VLLNKKAKRNETPKAVQKLKSFAIIPDATAPGKRTGMTKGHRIQIIKAPKHTAKMNSATVLRTTTILSIFGISL
jgi:hypothetical protein